MPAGFERINAKKSQPNSRIVFIKPLPGPDEAVAGDFLERIAAQCYPIMRENGIYVTSLEQYEFNREFVGRNFNAGEVIQLVLKARSGHWLPFDYVQMVMMHELAHCKQMNHSKAFWVVRNAYSEEMRKLWMKGYTGEGLWGRGNKLSTAQFEANTMRPNEPLPEKLCGGTYASRKRRKKIQGPRKLTAEDRKAQRERRILKKFGPGGNTLGSDDFKKRKLENGKALAAKPRVAASNRGRELRAAAALARFEQAQKDDERKPKLEEMLSGSDNSASETDSDGEDVILVDVNGNKLVDGNGRGLIKVCEGQGQDDKDSCEEVRELNRLRSFGLQRVMPSSTSFSTSQSSTGRNSNTKTPTDLGKTGVDSGNGTWTGDMTEEGDFNSKSAKPSTTRFASNHDRTPTNPNPALARKATDKKPAIATNEKSMMGKTSVPAAGRAICNGIKKRDGANDPNHHGMKDESCTACSFINKGLSATCAMCSHVLRPSSIPGGTWRCQSPLCVGQASKFLNAADYGTCRVCGARRPRAMPVAAAVRRC